MEITALKQLSEYKVGNSPLICAHNYRKSNNLFVKLESYNLNKNIKSRTAYYIIQDIIANSKVKNLVESSSGNLGLGLGYFAQEVGINFLCLIDCTVPKKKVEQLIENKINFKIVEQGSYPNNRVARISYAKELDKKEDWLWINQYDNDANFRAHLNSTGPEIYRQMNGKIDYLVCSVGTGGTICGTAGYLKKKVKDLKVVAVEPKGSTIFGGEEGEYMTAGSGLSYPSGIVKKYYDFIDYYSQIDDQSAIKECIDFLESEGESVGITTGAALCTAKKLAEDYPDKNIVCISPDGGESYEEYIQKYSGDNMKIQVKIHSTIRSSL